MQLSPNEKIFSHFLFKFPKSPQNLEYFEKEDENPRLFVSEILDLKKRGYLNAKKARCQNTYVQ